MNLPKSDGGDQGKSGSNQGLESRDSGIFWGSRAGRGSSNDGDLLASIAMAPSGTHEVAGSSTQLDGVLASGPLIQGRGGDAACVVSLCHLKDVVQWEVVENCTHRSPMQGLMICCMIRQTDLFALKRHEHSVL